MRINAGGTLTYEDNNMNGMGQSFMATVSTDNFVDPGDDLSFQVSTLTVLVLFALDAWMRPGTS